MKMKSLLILGIIFLTIGLVISCDNETHTIEFHEWLNGKTFRLTVSSSRDISATETTQYLIISTDNANIYVDKGVSIEGGSTPTNTYYSCTLEITNSVTTTNTYTATTKDGATYTFVNEGNNKITITIANDTKTSSTGSYTAEIITNQPSVYPKGVKTYLGEIEGNSSTAVYVMLTPAGMYCILFTNWERTDKTQDPLDVGDFKNCWLFMKDRITPTKNGFTVRIGEFTTKNGVNKFTTLDGEYILKEKAIDQNRMAKEVTDLISSGSGYGS